LLRTLLDTSDRSMAGVLLESIGDVNGDDQPDLVVVEPSMVWVFSGADGKVLYQLGEELRGAGLGQHVAGRLDATGDGVPDIVVCRASDGAQDAISSGLQCLFDGKTGKLVHVWGASTEAPVAAWTEREMYTHVPCRNFLGAATLVPDRDQDGKAELALALGGVTAVSEGEVENVIMVLSSADASTLARSVLPEASYMPWVMRPMGDWNGDGRDDLGVSIINDYFLVFSGIDGKELNRDSWRGAYEHGDGACFDIVGDLDGDSVEDYVLSANEDSGFLGDDLGWFNLCSGAGGKGLMYFSSGSGESLGDNAIGIDACGLGDVNGDGVNDVLMHRPRLHEVRIVSGKDFSILMMTKIRMITLNEDGTDGDR
jgi:hypothetical protein